MRVIDRALALLGSTALAACALGVGSGGGDDSSPPAPASPSGDDAGGAASDAGHTPAHDASPGADSGPSGGDDGGGATDSGGCYSEKYDPNAKLSDLSGTYASSAWLTDSIEAMHRRYGTGYFVLNAEQNDSQLPGFADSSSWPALMESLMTMVHEESHGWDFDHPKGNNHNYVLRDDLQIDVPQLTTWPRSDITQYITDDSTQSYDQTYLTGEQGTYDVIFLFEELNAYTNGCAAITAVGDQITQQISGRDGAVAHLLYLELYLKAGRTSHATDYAALKADSSWQKLVRYEWARAHFWDAQAKPNPLLDIGSAKIWTHVEDPANLDEIKQFTGDDPSVVACHP